MSISSRNALAREIDRLEAELDAREGGRRQAARSPRRKLSAKDRILAEIEDLERELDGDAVLSSEEDPSGVEEEITQDYLDDVEEEVGAEDEATDDSVLDVAPTEYVAKLRRASARLDRVAEELERKGRVNLAYRIDEISDAIDAQIEKEKRNG